MLFSILVMSLSTNISFLSKMFLLLHLHLHLFLFFPSPSLNPSYHPLPLPLLFPTLLLFLPLLLILLPLLLILLSLFLLVLVPVPVALLLDPHIFRTIYARPYTPSPLHPHLLHRPQVLLTLYLLFFLILVSHILILFF